MAEKEAGAGEDRTGRRRRRCRRRKGIVVERVGSGG